MCFAAWKIIKVAKKYISELLENDSNEIYFA